MSDDVAKQEGRLITMEKRELGEGLEASTNCENFENAEVRNCADTLFRETITGLEQALLESKRLLSQRDVEISALRSDLERLRGGRDADNRSSTLAEEVKSSQTKVLELERVIQHLQQVIQTFQAKQEPEGHECGADLGTGRTCYCGSLCGAMQEMVEVKKKLQQTEHKYSNLKKAFRQMEKGKLRVGVAHRDSPCTVS